jgi:hypothetical protein
MVISTTAMIIIAAWFRRSQFQSCFRTLLVNIPTVFRIPKNVVRKGSFRHNNHDELWFGSYRVTPAKPNITVTKQSPHRLAHSLTYPNKRRNDNDVLPHQSVWPASVDSPAIDCFASQQSRRPLSYEDEDSAPAAVSSRTKRTDRAANGYVQHADPPRVMPCGLARAWRGDRPLSVQTDGRAIVLPTALSTGLCNSQTLELGKTQKIGRIHSWWSTTDQWRADRSIVSRRSYESGRYPV